MTPPKRAGRWLCLVQALAKTEPRVAALPQVPKPSKNAKADGVLLKAIFGPEKDLKENYRLWRVKIVVDDPFEPSTYEMLPFLRARLRAARIKDDLSGRLQGVCRKVWVEAHRALEEPSRIVDQLTARGIPSLLEGRTALAACDPDRVSFTVHDKIDIVVREKDARLALASLQNLGWQAPAWMRRIDLFENDSVTLVDANWRPLRLSWRTFSGHASPKMEKDAWNRAQRVERLGTRFGVLEPCDAMAQALAKALAQGQPINLFELGMVFQRFIEEGGHWQALIDRLISLGAASQASPTLGHLAQAFDASEARQASATPSRIAPPLAQRVVAWSDALGDAAFQRRLKRAANFVARRLRHSEAPGKTHLALAAGSYLAFRLTPASWRKSTAFLGAKSGPDSQLQRSSSQIAPQFP